MRTFHFDIIAHDSTGKIILLVEVKARHFENRQHRDGLIEQVQSYLQALQAVNMKIPFAMLVDLEKIEIFRGNTSDWSEPVSSLQTATVLSHYEPEYGKKRIFYPYLERLVESWLRDLAYHWKSETPPASEQLAEIGLLQKLAGGTTYSNFKMALSGETLY